jgi:hypothetical protein
MIFNAGKGLAEMSGGLAADGLPEPVPTPLPSLPEIEAAKKSLEEGDFSKLSDIKVDLKTGRAYVSEKTYDIVLIFGVDVAIQNLAITFNTQIGTVKRQGIDDFGWDKRGRIKQKKTIDNITTISNKLTELALNDQYVKDATVDTADSGEDELNFLVNVLLIDGNWYAIPVTVN